MVKKSVEKFGRFQTRLAGRLAEYREDKGLSQAALAKKAGVKQQYISDIERRKRNPTLRSLVALADALDVQPRDLLAGIPREKYEE